MAILELIMIKGTNGKMIFKGKEYQITSWTMTLTKPPVQLVRCADGVYRKPVELIKYRLN